MAMTVRYTVVEGEIIAEKRSGTRSLYVPDPHGSTIALLNSAQHITDVFSYWAYGINFHSLGSNPTPFIFLGTLGYYKDDVNRTYVRARVMDKVKARWITQDPIGFAGGDWNLYRYAENSPVTKIEPNSGIVSSPVAYTGLSSLYPNVAQLSFGSASCLIPISINKWNYPPYWPPEGWPPSCSQYSNLLVQCFCECSDAAGDRYDFFWLLYMNCLDVHPDDPVICVAQWDENNRSVKVFYAKCIDTCKKAILA